MIIIYINTLYFKHITQIDDFPLNEYPANISICFKKKQLLFIIIIFIHTYNMCKAPCNNAPTNNAMQSVRTKNKIDKSW